MYKCIYMYMCYIYYSVTSFMDKAFRVFFRIALKPVSLVKQKIFALISETDHLMHTKRVTRTRFQWVRSQLNPH